MRRRKRTNILVLLGDLLIGEHNLGAHHASNSLVVVVLLRRIGDTAVATFAGAAAVVAFVGIGRLARRERHLRVALLGAVRSGRLDVGALRRRRRRRMRWRRSVALLRRGGRRCRVGVGGGGLGLVGIEREHPTEKRTTASKVGGAFKL